MFKEAVDYDATTTFNDPLPFSIATIKDNIRFYRNEDTK